MTSKVYDFYNELTRLTEFEVKKLDPDSLKNGIAVRVPNWLGDACMALPALMQLKKIIPEHCGLFVICPPAVSAIFKSMPIVDAVAELHEPHTGWNDEDRKAVMQFRAGAAFLFNNSLRDVLELRRCGIRKQLFGAAARCRGIFLKRSFKFPKRKKLVFNHDQHTARYLSMVRAVGAPEWDGALPEIVISKNLEEIPEFTRSLCGRHKLLTISAGAAYGRAKCWGTDNFRQVAEVWIKNGGTVVVTGTAKDRGSSQEVIEGLPENKAFNLAGQTDIYDLMHLLQSSDGTIANDSGVMHLAAALGGRGVAIFGSTDPSWTAPISKKWRLVVAEETCGPCFKRECGNGSYKCMESIQPEEVISELYSVVG